MAPTRRRVLRVLAIVSAALWIACLLSMAAFSEGADQLDEGVNVTALHLTLVALLLTIATALLAGRSQPTGHPGARGSEPQG